MLSQNWRKKYLVLKFFIVVILLVYSIQQENEMYIRCKNISTQPSQAKRLDGPI